MNVLRLTFTLCLANIRGLFIKRNISHQCLIFQLLLILQSQWFLRHRSGLSLSRDVERHCSHELRITGKFPGYLSPSAGLKFADVPNGLAAISKVPAAGWGQILAYMAFCEVSQDQSPGTPAAAGDFGFKVLTSSDPAEKTKKLNAELANGRLAMMAIIGMFFQAALQRDLCSFKEISSWIKCGFKKTL